MQNIKGKDAKGGFQLMHKFVGTNEDHAKKFSKYYRKIPISRLFKSGGLVTN